MDYPLPSYNYAVTLGGETLGFSEISGLSIGYEDSVYRHGLSFRTGPKKLIGNRTQTRITMQRGVFKGGTLSAFYQWLAHINPDNAAELDVVVDLRDENGNPSVT
ncbi:MAG: phage tail protein, partial [Verrucomicrobiota bacterium]